ncbi:MAG: N-acetyltransferase family protein [Bacteroidota bacterium]
MEIRPLLAEDWTMVKTIYELGIATGIATFETSAPSWEKWADNHLPYGRLVAKVNGQVTGWAALTAVSNRCIYQGVAEVSVYVHPQFQGQGVGQSLLKQLIFESEANGIWTLHAAIFRENIGSIKLHQKVGFRMIGYREKIGKLHGVWKDNVLMERRSSVVGTD